MSTRCWTGLTLAAIALLGVGLGCPPGPGGPIAPPPAGPQAAWSTAPRTVRYQVTETLPAGGRGGGAQTQFELLLDFGPGGVTVAEMSRKRRATMSGEGRLTLSSANDPVVLYELPALSVLPPAGTPLAVGTSWSVRRPSDAEAAASGALVGQERFEYEVTAVTATEVTVRATGYLRIAPSAGLKAFLKDQVAFPASMAAPFVTGWSRYSEGSAVFQRADGETLRAEGTRVPFGLFRGDTTVAGAPGRLQYAVTRR